MRFLPVVVMGASIAFALLAEGCTDRACLQWKKESQGECPNQADARKYFGTCSAITKVESGPTFDEVDGGLCCYDVVKTDNHFIPCGDGQSSGANPSGAGGAATDPPNAGGGPIPGTGPGGGAGAGGGGGSGGAACGTCADALKGDDLGDFCDQSASDAFGGVAACACASACAACQGFCEHGASTLVSCVDCLVEGGECADALAACKQH